MGCPPLLWLHVSASLHHRKQEVFPPEATQLRPLRFSPRPGCCASPRYWTWPAWQCLSSSASLPSRSSHSRSAHCRRAAVHQSRSARRGCCARSHSVRSVASNPRGRAFPDRKALSRRSFHFRYDRSHSLDRSLDRSSGQPAHFWTSPLRQMESARHPQPKGAASRLPFALLSRSRRTAVGATRRGPACLGASLHN